MKRISICFLVTLIVLSSCSKDDILFGDPDCPNEESLFQYSVIGEKQPNPLEISNVIAAFDQLPPETKCGFTSNDIKATHIYRFYPD